MAQQETEVIIEISGRWWSFPGAQIGTDSWEIEWGNDGKLRLHDGVGSVVEGTELTDAEIEQQTRENLLADVLELASAKLRSGESWDAATTGTASGINNAVARVAGVLAVAVLGAVMAAAFSYSLRESLPRLNLNVGIVRQLESNVARLGSLDAPPGVDSRTAAGIRSAISDAFIFGFRLIVLVCAVLSIASAAVAWGKIPGGSAARAPDLGGVAATD